jgi:hypothetical protein
MESSLVPSIHDILQRLEASFVYDQLEAIIKVIRNFVMTPNGHESL